MRNFALRRVGRIVPSDYVSILVTIGLLTVLPASYPAPHDVQAVLAHLSFIHSQLYFPQIGLGINAVWWTLSTIALFYVALPLVAVRYLSLPLLALLVAGLWPPAGSGTSAWASSSTT